MTCRDLTQPSFAEALVADFTKSGGILQDIESAFDWKALEVLLSRIHGSAKGAPGYPPLALFKILPLQKWYTLSDPAAEEAVRDRLSFRRFCGVPLDRETPDHSSIWRFRQTIDNLGLSGALLAEVNRQLEARGLIIKRGTLVDATIIAGAVRRPYEGGGINPRDPDARFTRKRDKTYFGYNAHLAVDEESGLVRQAEMTPANVHDGQLGERLIQGDEQGFSPTKPMTARPCARRWRGAASSMESPGRSNTRAIRSRPGRSSSTLGRPASAPASSAPVRR